MGKSVFITGAEKSVGKTYVSNLLAAKLNRQGLKTAYYDAADKDPATAKNEYEKLVADNDCVIVEAAKEETGAALGLPCAIVSGTGNQDGVEEASAKLKALGVNVKGIIYNRCHLGNMMEDNDIFNIERTTGLRTLAKVIDGATEIDSEISEISFLFR